MFLVQILFESIGELDQGLDHFWQNQFPATYDLMEKLHGKD